MGIELDGCADGAYDVRPTPLGPVAPWSYVDRALELMADARSVLDMGTGGGETFSQLCDGYGGLAIATEGWSGNVPVAARWLGAMGVPVVHASSLRLPFASASLDLVLNRHEKLEPADVTRVLAPGGTVLTQQVGSSNWRELRSFFPRMTDFGAPFDMYTDGFGRAGLTVIRAKDHETPVAYGSLGDVVYLLTAAPWTVPEFDLDHDLDALLALEEGLYRQDRIVLTENRFIIEAQKPGP